ncbi:MAG: fused response regulator/phosphatase [Spirochaetes bacterium]|nr:fused response regulator/phosphatase [Spirochaetota bacterium]MBU1079726.1 fused response regulator/phosphatase [Spirochaetota bacterium]
MPVQEKRLRLVIVDDEPRVAKALEREIRMRYTEDAFDIRAFDDPLAYLDETDPQGGDDFLVISDLRMPTMNGAELLERVRAADPDIQTVLLTAYSDMDDIRRAVSSDIRGLLQKPWNQGSLYAEIDGALSEYRLRKENSRLKEELARQLSTAGAFQRAILGSMSAPAYPAVSVEYRPLERLSCGGDYYDSFELPDGRTAILVGDVSGHGIKPALVTLIVKTVVQGSRFLRAEKYDSPAGFLSELNDDLCAMLASSPDTIVAFAAAFVDPKAMTVAVSNAGLPDALLCSGGGVKDIFSFDGPALGFQRGLEYSQRTAAFAPGDAIVMFTDGLVDDVSVGELLSSNKLALEIAEAVGGGLGPAGLCDAILSRHPGKAFSDDVTVLIASL